MADLANSDRYRVPASPNKIIQGLWIGAELSLMEQLSISSFLLNGHDYHLYIYDEPKHIPVGTVIMDASEILPASQIFQYKDRPSYAGFSNFFRYKLLLERGGWWADTDTVCLKPFDFSDEYVFSSEINHKGREVVNSGAIKAPVGSVLMEYLWEVCQTKNTASLLWGDIGPKLMAKAVEKFGLERCMTTYKTFCPIDWHKWQKLIQPRLELLFDERTYAVHLWNEMWRLASQDKNAEYHPTCLYEKLKRTYLHHNAMLQGGPARPIV